MASVLTVLAITAGCGLLIWIAYRMEPHWVSKDGERMVCYSQGIGRGGWSDSRWREVRVARVRPDTVEVRQRRAGSTGTTRHDAMAYPTRLLQGRRPKVSYWKVIGPSDAPHKRRVIYLLDGSHDPNVPEMLALRLPLNSKAIPMLDAVAASRHSSTASRPSREKPRLAEPPDPG